MTDSQRQHLGRVFDVRGVMVAFRGFADLVAELDTSTPLAQHVTTNGTRIDDAMWPAFAGRFGTVRLSIDDDTPWQRAAQTLSGFGQRCGASLLVDRARLRPLPQLLNALAAAVCHDVSLLFYVGPDVSRHLHADDDRALADRISDSLIPCRVSVCCCDRLLVPRLLAGDDCEAGRDVVLITSDGRVQARSFHACFPFDRSERASTALLACGQRDDLDGVVDVVSLGVGWTRKPLEGH